MWSLVPVPLMDRVRIENSPWRKIIFHRPTVCVGGWGSRGDENSKRVVFLIQNTTREAIQQAEPWGDSLMFRHNVSPSMIRWSTSLVSFSSPKDAHRRQGTRNHLVIVISFHQRDGRNFKWQRDSQPRCGMKMLIGATKRTTINPYIRPSSL